MSKSKIYWLYFLGIPKTIYFNFKYFPILIALKFPIFISQNVLLNKCKGSIEINGRITTGMIKIGYGYVPIFDRYKSRTVWNVQGKIIFDGICNIGHGSKIGVGGTLILGNNFIITAESTILCDNYIRFGENVLISWNCQIMDTDFHSIYIDEVQQNPIGKIIIGNCNWICSNVQLLKNTQFSNNNVIAAGSILNKNYNCSNTLIAGAPAKLIKSNITWK
jgi:acetyltransferase-like isoleucine patch superfamily enzyme